MKNQTNSQKNFILMGADGGLVYTLAVFFSLVVSVIFNVIIVSMGLNEDESFLNSALYTHLSFAIPALSLGIIVFYTLKRQNLDFALTLCFKRCQTKYYLLAIAFAFASLFGLGWLNEQFIYFLESLGFKISSVTLPNSSIGDYILCIITVCVLPAFFEECIFRGLILNGCKRLGDYFAVVLCAVLFSLYHKNPAQTIYQLIIGGVLTLLTLRSGSILPAILYHFINNFYLVTYNQFVSPSFIFEPWLQILLMLLGIAVFVVSLLYLWKGCKNPECDQRFNEDFLKIVSVQSERKNFLIFASLGIAVCLVTWIVNLF
ncbi:MAG: CPBP family intramembrane metalloprotease [Clostridia bacterium]|nr:CPBP family intramembrane metalloprotease [Clostridia bacterium]